MQLLIDGHNLVGKVPDLSLADFDDEEKLIDMLRKYAARRTRNRRASRRVRIVVVFDSGSPGGRSHALSGGGVESIFAADGYTNADRILIERIREAKRPQEWTLVSGDREVQREAKRRRMPIIESADFAKKLLPSQSKSPPKPKDNKPEHEDDVQGWLDIFTER